MSTAVDYGVRTDATVKRVAGGPVATRPAPAPARGPQRTGPGRGTGPAARPRRPATATGPGRATGPWTGRRVRSCTAPAAPPAAVRLTDRGIALVLLVGLVIAAAAVVVVGLTAVTVTGPGYQPVGQSVLAPG